MRRAAAHLFSARVDLGLLDPPEASPFLQDLRELDSDANRAASADAARQGIVLLSNPRGTLPLAFGALQGIAIVGPNADNAAVLLGNYQGTPPFIITLREGLIRALGGNSSAVPFAPGCADVPCTSTSGFPAAVAAAESPSAGAIVAVVGLDDTQEAEGLDRVNLTLPGQQLDLLQASTTRPVALRTPLITPTSPPIALGRRCYPSHGPAVSPSSSPSSPEGPSTWHGRSRTRMRWFSWGTRRSPRATLSPTS